MKVNIGASCLEVSLSRNMLRRKSGSSIRIDNEYRWPSPITDEADSNWPVSSFGKALVVVNYGDLQKSIQVDFLCRDNDCCTFKKHQSNSIKISRRYVLL